MVVYTDLIGVELRRIVEGFRDAQNIHCQETIYQADRVIENAYEFIEELLNVVGYVDLGDDE